MPWKSIFGVFAAKQRGAVRLPENTQTFLLSPGYVCAEICRAEQHRQHKNSMSGQLAFDCKQPARFSFFARSGHIKITPAHSYAPKVKFWLSSFVIFDILYNIAGLTLQQAAYSSDIFPRYKLRTPYFLHCGFAEKLFFPQAIGRISGGFQLWEDINFIFYRHCTFPFCFYWARWYNSTPFHDNNYITYMHT